MTCEVMDPPRDRCQPARMRPHLVQQSLCVLRTGVGVGTWVAPGPAGVLFGLGPAMAPADSALVGRLFAVRDLVLAQALRHPDREVQRLALQAGLAIDAVDAVASGLAVVRGGRRSGLVGVGCGALLFVAMGAAALRELPPG